MSRYPFTAHVSTTPCVTRAIRVCYSCDPCLYRDGVFASVTVYFAGFTLFAGKRISQKLLRNCVKFLSIIHDVLKIAPREYIKQSSDEIDIRGPESKYDSRKINSYPSKVGIVCAFLLDFQAFSLLRGCGPFVAFASIDSRNAAAKLMGCA